MQFNSPNQNLEHEYHELVLAEPTDDVVHLASIICVMASAPSACSGYLSLSITLILGLFIHSSDALTMLNFLYHLFVWLRLLDGERVYAKIVSWWFEVMQFCLICRMSLGVVLDPSQVIAIDKHIHSSLTPWGLAR